MKKDMLAKSAFAALVLAASSPVVGVATSFESTGTLLAGGCGARSGSACGAANNPSYRSGCGAANNNNWQQNPNSNYRAGCGAAPANYKAGCGAASANYKAGCGAAVNSNGATGAAAKKFTAMNDTVAGNSGAGSNSRFFADNDAQGYYQAPANSNPNMNPNMKQGNAKNPAMNPDMPGSNNLSNSPANPGPTSDNFNPRASN